MFAVIREQFVRVSVKKRRRETNYVSRPAKEQVDSNRPKQSQTRTPGEARTVFDGL